MSAEIRLDEYSEDDEYLIFVMDNQEYGINVLSVQEIRQWETVKPLPKVPDYIKGIINLRGLVIPIIDLRMMLSIDNLTYDTKTVTLVLKKEIRGKACTIGIVVDSVSDVIKIHTEKIQEKPELGSKIDLKFIKCVAKINDSIVILLASDVFLDIEELVGINKKI